MKSTGSAMTDSAGDPVPDEAIPGAGPGGVHQVDTVISFEKEGAYVEVTDAAGAFVWDFVPEPFPGIPGTGGHFDKFAVEVVTFLELSAGEHTFGVSVGADRTDVNDDDGDLFWQGGNFGQGGGGYNGKGTFTAGSWRRVAAAFAMAATPPVVVKYVDGIKQDDWTANQGLDNPRRALLPTAVLFADGDQDERREWWVSAIQIRSAPLTTLEIESLGGPSAAGIPIVLEVTPPPTLSIVQNDGSVVISWPADAVGYRLEATDALPASGWTEVATGGVNSATVTIAGDMQFFRLSR